MRIAWFTPFSTRSAIGDFSQHITAALAAHAEVDIWTADEGERPEAEMPLIRIGGTGAPEAALAGYDALVYNMGNYHPFHREIHEISMRHPGIVILHDRVLHHFFAAHWESAGGGSSARYVARMAANHGEAGAQAARACVAGRRGPLLESDEEVARFPLDTEALRRALGAVTHSHEHARDLRSRWLGPVLALDLPCYRNAVELGQRAGDGPPPRDDARIQLTTIGHVIANKRIDDVVRMLAADEELANRVQYTVVGSLDPESPYVVELQELLRETPQVRVALRGWCEPDELDRLMANTDVFVNLRHPVMESGSSSLARELAFGRAILCFDAGCFGEVPGDAVARVPAADFDAAAQALSRLVRDADERRRLGRRAAEVAAGRTEDAYARALVEFVAEVQRVSPALRLLDRVGGELATMSADPSLPVFDAIANDFGRILAL